MCFDSRFDTRIKRYENTMMGGRLFETSVKMFFRTINLEKCNVGQ